MEEYNYMQTNDSISKYFEKINLTLYSNSTAPLMTFNIKPSFKFLLKYGSTDFREKQIIEMKLNL